VHVAGSCFHWLTGPGASACVVAVVWCYMGGCGNGAQIDGCWEKHYDGDCGHYDEVPDSLSKLRFSTSVKA